MKTIFTIILGGIIILSNKVHATSFNLIQQQVEFGDSVNSKTPLPLDASIELSDDKKVLLFIITDEATKTMNDSLVNGLKHGTFIQPDLFIMPDEISKLLGSDIPLRIVPGIYPVSHKDGKYIVKFELVLTNISNPLKSH